jgi:outer membrane protein assembly factor BamB
LKAGIQCAPAFFKDQLIVGSNDGRVQALDAKSGKSRWEYDSGPDAILSSPVIHGGQVYFGTMDGHVVSLFAATGKLAWKGKVEGSVFATGRIVGDPARFVVGTGKGKLVSLSAATGAVQWEYQAGNHIKATPACDGERLFFGAWDGCFYALDAKTGGEAWKLKMNSPHFSPATCNPQVQDDKVIVVTHDHRALDVFDTIYEMEVDFNWNGVIVARCKPSYSSAVFYGGAAYLGSLTGHVVGFDLATGKQVLEAPVDDPIFDSFPVLQGDRMYFGTVGGTLYAFDLKAKAPAWKYSLGPHFIFAPPATDGKYLAIGDLAGQLACIEIG